MSDKFMEWLSGACIGFLIGAYVQRKTMQEEIRKIEREKQEAINNYRWPPYKEWTQGGLLGCYENANNLTSDQCNSMGFAAALGADSSLFSSSELHELERIYSLKAPEGDK